MLMPRIFELLAAALSRVPSHSGHVANRAARSTNARRCGCRASTSLLSSDFCTRGTSPSNVKPVVSWRTLRASPESRSWRCSGVRSRTGTSPGTTTVNTRTSHPSAVYPGTLMAPSRSESDSSTSAARSISLTLPMPSQRGHTPPVTVKLRATACPSPRSTTASPVPVADAMLNENACAGPTYGSPSRLNRMRRRVCTSVAVPTVERTFAPIRSWSTMIAVVRPSRTSTSGRARLGMNPWTNALYVSLMSRWDSAAMVSKTSELLPEPETPVNTVRRRLGISTCTSCRLFSRAPTTRMTSWLSAGCRAAPPAVVAADVVVVPVRVVPVVLIPPPAPTSGTRHPAPAHRHRPRGDPPPSGRAPPSDPAPPARGPPSQGLLDADHAARRVAERAVADPVRLVHGLLGDLRTARLDPREDRVDVVDGQ